MKKGAALILFGIMIVSFSPIVLSNNKWEIKKDGCTCLIIKWRFDNVIASEAWQSHINGHLFFLPHFFPLTNETDFRFDYFFCSCYMKN